MMFSTHPPEALPKVGDLVTMHHCGYPWTVTKRSRNRFQQVMMVVTPPAGPSQLVMVEVLNWWPAVGDICTVLAKPYGDWLQTTGAKRWDCEDYNNAQSWLYGEFPVTDIDRDMATVQGGKRSQRVPLGCLAVVKRPSVERALQNV